MGEFQLNRKMETEYDFDLSAEQELIDARATWAATRTDADFIRYTTAKRRIISSLYSIDPILTIEEFKFNNPLQRSTLMDYEAYRNGRKNYIYSMVIAAYVERNMPPRQHWQTKRSYRKAKQDMRWQASLDFSARWEELTQEIDYNPNILGLAAATLIAEQLADEEQKIRAVWGIQ